MRQTADFPYYNGQPVPVTARGWLILIGSLALGFAALTLAPLFPFPLTIIPVLAFVAIPLIALALVTGRHWTALFGRVGVRQILLMVVFGLLTLAASFGIAIVLSLIMDFTQNPVSESMRSMSGVDFALTLAMTIPQLIGEELLAILPFLAVLWLGVTRMGLPRPMMIVIALVLSSLLFGAAHLPTYGWNWIQALGVIGTARIIMTLAYVVTRNLWVSAGAHILNDWAGFLLVFTFTHAPIGGPA